MSQEMRIMNTNRRFVLAALIATTLTLWAPSPMRAGFYSYSNSLGTGQADTRVRNQANTESNRFVTATLTKPSSGFNTNLTLTVKGTWSNNLPTRAFSKIGDRGIITNKGYPVNGDAIDSGDPDLDQLVEASSACPAIELESEPLDVYDEQNHLDLYAYRYLLTIIGTDPGTALKVSWYEHPDPADRDDLIANGHKLAELLFVGPIHLENYDCVVVRSSLGRQFIHVVTAGTAESLPFYIAECPGDVVIGCNELLQYPVASITNNIVGGVPPYTVTINPPLAQLPDGATNTVTATVSDANGCSAGSCEFLIIRTGTVTFDGFQSPINGVGGTCSTPLRTIKRGSSLPVKFKATCNGVPISTRPHVEVKNCATGQILASGDAIQETSSVWHFNVDSSLAGFQNAIIEIVVNLPGGYSKKAVIKLKG
jgi:hypothetical protein